LDPAQIAASRTVLRHYGNLSSATILFVLDEVRRTLAHADRRGKTQRGVAMAFGPGLVIEMMRLTYLPPQTASHQTSTAMRNGNLMEPA
jgi:predicted naringenin-chalcone synthase